MRLARAIVLEAAVRSWPWVKRGGFVVALVVASWQMAGDIMLGMGL